MIKLFKKTDDSFEYWEAWDTGNNSAIIHWGNVGESGKHVEIKSGISTNYNSKIQKEIDQKLNEGYSEFDEDKISFLEIEYKIDGFGSDKDLNKRHRLEEKMDEFLGWRGLGNTDGGSIGSGTMEVGCMVVDFKLAKEVIEKELMNTEFADFSRIYEMSSD